MQDFFNPLFRHFNQWRAVLLALLNNPKSTWNDRSQRKILSVIFYHFVFFLLSLGVSVRFIYGDFGQFLFWLSLAIFSITTYFKLFHVRSLTSKLTLFDYIYVSLMVGWHRYLAAYCVYQNVMTSLLLSGLYVLIIIIVFGLDYLYVNKLWMFIDAELDDDDSMRRRPRY
jgi:hypothetical protein